MASPVPSLLAFFVLSSTLHIATALPPPPPPPSASPSPSIAPNCTDKLSILSYVASPPNDLTDVADANCCNAFSAAAKSGVAVCFCYLLRDPPILGFPLNGTRLLSLSSDCPLANRESAAAPSLNSLCSESRVLPPLNNSANLGLTFPSPSGSGSGASSQELIPSKGGGRGGSSGNRGGDRSRRRGGGSSGVVIVAGLHDDSSSETKICRSTGWLLLSMFSLLISYMCCSCSSALGKIEELD